MPKRTDPIRDAGATLRRSPITAAELVEAIHSVNPTGLDLAPALAKARYALKSKLQSRLILEFFDELEFEQAEILAIWAMVKRWDEADH